MNQPQIPLYQPGTLLTVGSHKVQVVKYLTSGGFAQIYTVQISPPDKFTNTNVACLKRVIVPDKPSLNTLRAEVDTMKLLRNNAHVVSYIDSHAAKFNPNEGSYEVFLLMEYCDMGGLIDFMNTRLQERLREDEILNIMSQVTQGIAAMHALHPPLLHRDIKIENVLLTSKGEYKVCDFGSVCGIIRPPSNAQEVSYVQHDIMKNTTAQYRAPEMIDLYRGLPIDEKSDIWALGVFLYKLCYYTTPFEKNGEAAILHATFQFPNYPQYSDRLKKLITYMLMEQPSQRPNSYQVLEEVSSMQNVQCPIPNFYLMNNNVTQGQMAMQTQPQNNGAMMASPNMQPYVPNNNFVYNTPNAVSMNDIQMMNAINLKVNSTHNTGMIPPTMATNMARTIPMQPVQKSQTLPVSSIPTNLQNTNKSSPFNLKSTTTYVDSETQTETPKQTLNKAISSNTEGFSLINEKNPNSVPMLSPSFSTSSSSSSSDENDSVDLRNKASLFSN